MCENDDSNNSQRSWQKCRKGNQACVQPSNDEYLAILASTKRNIGHRAQATN